MSWKMRPTFGNNKSIFRLQNQSNWIFAKHFPIMIVGLNKKMIAYNPKLYSILQFFGVIFDLILKLLKETKNLFPQNV